MVRVTVRGSYIGYGFGSRLGSRLGLALGSAGQVGMNVMVDQWLELGYGPGYG